jgi:hypothetical protein
MKEEMEKAQPLEKKWWYACRLLGTISLKEAAMWYVDPLLGNDRKICNYMTAVDKSWLCKQWLSVGSD